MTTERPPGPGEDRQDSLLHPLDALARYPAGLNPDPLEAAQFVTGAGDGHSWHAIGCDHAGHANTRAAGGITIAVCGALVRVSRHGVYDRASAPVIDGPCPACAWRVAIATSNTERELRLTWLPARCWRPARPAAGNAAWFLTMWRDATADQIEQAASALQTSYYEGDRAPEGDAEIIVARLARLREGEGPRPVLVVQAAPRPQHAVRLTANGRADARHGVPV